MRWVDNATFRPLYPRQRDPVSIVQKSGWVQGCSERVRKISPPSGFDPRTFQPVASRYIDYFVSAHLKLNNCQLFQLIGYKLILFFQLFTGNRSM